MASGRWSSDEQRGARRDEILDATLALLAERGYDGTSMQRVAAAARTSKETLYGWFGDKPGLFEALVEREAHSMNAELVAALARGGEPRDALVRFGADVLALLLGPRSLTINRAAIAAAGSAPELGRILAAKGRETTRPLVERFLGERLGLDDPSEAFELLMGLLVRDLQVRMLFGAAVPLDEGERRRRAGVAVDALLALQAGIGSSASGP